jgi:hypothetical protein
VSVTKDVSPEWRKGDIPDQHPDTTKIDFGRTTVGLQFVGAHDLAHARVLNGSTVQFIEDVLTNRGIIAATPRDHQRNLKRPPTGVRGKGGRSDLTSVENTN